MIFKHFEHLGLSRSILVYFCLSLSPSVYLSLSRTILDYLGRLWQSWTISVLLDLYLDILGYVGLTLAFSGYAIYDYF